jgi:hypothetical protein
MIVNLPWPKLTISFPWVKRHLGKQHDQSSHGRDGGLAAKIAVKSHYIGHTGKPIDPTTASFIDIPVSNPLLETFRDGSRAVTKPANLDPSMGGHKGPSEVLAANVSKLLRIGDVPETVWVDNHPILKEPATRQVFMEGKKTASEVQGSMGQKKFAKQYRKQLDELFVFDSVIGNKDRHPFNILVDEEAGKLIAIDHGHADWKVRPSIVRSIGDLYKNRFGSSLGPTVRLSTEQKTRWGKITEEKFKAEMSQGLPGKSTFETDAAWYNFKEILKQGGVSY